MTIGAISLTQSSSKTLTTVEVDVASSNQHELQGVNALRNIFGTQRNTFSATFSLRGSADNHSVDLTWYDAREGNPNRSPEYRLYFQSNPVMEHAQAGDELLVGITRLGNIHCELIPR
ncbi:TPA: type II restriction endonuclease [Photobacterium damselae]